MRREQITAAEQPDVLEALEVLGRERLVEYIDLRPVPRLLRAG
jgi:hypothetical protein